MGVDLVFVTLLCSPLLPAKQSVTQTTQNLSSFKKLTHRLFVQAAYDNLKLCV